MAIFTNPHPLILTFGLLGNIISFMVYLSPVPTFYRIYKKKCTEGFQSIPYVVALFSAMLWIYYALIKTSTPLLITINAVGCFIESLYIIIFLVYASASARKSTIKFFALLNVGVFGLIVLLTMFLSRGTNRAQVVGWICVAFSVCVFAAPLSIIRLVIRTKSVEYMPFSLSFFLTLSAVTWFSYGFLLKDRYIAFPNILGFIFGLVQMILYLIYKDDKKKIIIQENKLPEIALDLPKTVVMPSSDVSPVEVRRTQNGIDGQRTYELTEINFNSIGHTNGGEIRLNI